MKILAFLKNDTMPGIISRQFVQYAVLATVMTVASVTNGYAQTSDGANAPHRPLRVKLGFVGTTSFGGIYQGFVSSNPFSLVPENIPFQFAGGLSYDLQPMKANRSTVATVYVDTFSGDSDLGFVNLLLSPLFGGETKATVNTVGVGAGIRYISGHSRRHFVYLESGIGLYSVHVKLDELTFPQNGGPVTTPRYSASQIKPGGKLAIGYQFSPQFFTEYEQMFIDTFKHNGVTYNPSSGRFSLGFAF